MKSIGKLLFVIFLALCTISVAFAEEEWKDISFFKRIDYKIRVIKHYPPIVLDLDKAFNETLPDKLEPIVYMLPAICKDYDKWKSYCTDSYIDALQMTKEKFEEKSNIDLKKDYAGYRFVSVFYEVDYLIDDKEYSFIACRRDPENINEYPQDMQKYIKEKGGVGAFLLFKEDGIWKNHDIDNRLFYDGELEFSTLDLLNKDLILKFSPYDLLITIMEKGFVYKSKEHVSVWPFEPSETLKTDSYVPTYHSYNYLKSRPRKK
ncbi:MAG: hypothetical protein ABH952_07535 [Candidatus Omnitrophota bacterium]